MNDAPSGLLDERYELLGVLGRGGMATVYQGYARDLARNVAIKVLDREVTDQGTMQRQFLNELLLATQVRHPNVVEIYDFGVSEEGKPYLVMELLPGHTVLDEVRHHGRFSMGRAIRRVIEATYGVEAAHAQGVVHADLKPNNLFLRHPGLPGESTVILDFGVARRESGPQVVSGGTPRYMPPEVLRGALPQPQGDIYQLGLVLGEIIAGRTLFRAKTTRECLSLHAAGPLPLPPEVDESAVGLVIRSTLHADPRKRLGTAAELRAALELAMLDVPETDELSVADTEMLDERSSSHSRPHRAYASSSPRRVPSASPHRSQAPVRERVSRAPSVDAPQAGLRA